jgi:hypothetical protein
MLHYYAAPALMNEASKKKKGCNVSSLIKKHIVRTAPANVQPAIYACMLYNHVIIIHRRSPPRPGDRAILLAAYIMSSTTNIQHICTYTVHTTVLGQCCLPTCDTHIYTTRAMHTHLLPLSHDTTDHHTCAHDTSQTTPALAKSHSSQPHTNSPLPAVIYVITP